MLSYVDLRYKPSKDDLVACFLVEPNGVSVKKAAENIAAESSVGTWTEVSTMTKHIAGMRARVFSIKGKAVKIAYPSVLFEHGNMPQILSSVAGNIFGMKVVKSLRLDDIFLPMSLVKSFKGPKFGIDGVCHVLDVKHRPLLGTIVKPKIGLNAENHSRVAFEAWLGGCDLVKDDENLSSQNFNNFEKRVMLALKAREKAEEVTGERKAYMPNVTAEACEMLRRAGFVRELGGRYAMVDILTVGWSALQTLRNANLRLILHAHRAGHAALTKGKNGISMRVLAKLARIIGVDQLHVGAGVGKMSEGKEEVLANKAALTDKLFGISNVFPVCSGGLHPGLVEKEVKLMGKDIIIQMGGGIHWHPKGTMLGAVAARQAVDAVAQGIGVREYSKGHEELACALRQWS